MRLDLGCHHPNCTENLRAGSWCGDNSAGTYRSYITLPDGRRFATAVFTKSSETSEADRDRAIAEVAPSLYDYFYVGQMAKQ